MHLWENTPGKCDEIPQITYYKSTNRIGRAAVVIYPGGGYCCRAPHEGEGYAVYFNSIGLDAFVVDYRVSPHAYPLPLLDGRRGIRWVRAHAEEYGIDKNQILACGSSAGGHMVALLANYKAELEFEGYDDIDKEDYVPDAQILCYPCTGVADENIRFCYDALLGAHAELLDDMDMNKAVTKDTPPAFIWSTMDDPVVNTTLNCIPYALAMKTAGVPVELHLMLHGSHGMGLAPADTSVGQWTTLLRQWLKQTKML